MQCSRGRLHIRLKKKQSVRLPPIVHDIVHVCYQCQCEWVILPEPLPIHPLAKRRKDILAAPSPHFIVSSPHLVILLWS